MFSNYVLFINEWTCKNTEQYFIWPKIIPEEYIFCFNIILFITQTSIFWKIQHTKPTTHDIDLLFRPACWFNLDSCKNRGKVCMQEKGVLSWWILDTHFWYSLFKRIPIGNLKNVGFGASNEGYIRTIYALYTDYIRTIYARHTLQTRSKDPPDT